MWSKFTGKSDSASQDGRRKGSSSNTRRRESVVSSNSTRKPARGDDKPPPPSSRNSYPPPESTTSSYATAPDAFRFADPSRYDSMPENLTRARSEYDARSVVEDDRRSTRSRRARSSSRERKKDRKDRSRSRDRDDKKKDKKKKDDSSGKSRKESRSESRIVDSPTTTRAGDDLRANGSFSAQIGTPGFSAFQGQVGAPVSPKPNAMSAHVADQFPGQNPSQYTEPFQSPYGAAAEYYLDQGQSVASQPGVRPSQPLVNADPHLITPTAASNPPSETGQGTAMDFFTGKVSPVYPLPAKPPRPNQTMPGSFEDSPPTKPPRPSSSKPSKPSKTSKPSGSSKPDRPNKTSTAAELATGAALGYAVGHHNSHGQTESQYISAGSNPTTPFYQHGSGVPNGSTDNFSIQAQSSEYASHADPASAPLNVYGPSASGSFSTPGKTSHSHSNIPMYAAGAAGLAAGAYGLHAGSHNQNLPLPPGAFPSSPRMSPAPFAAGVTTMRHQHQGPISKLVAWWKDHEDVRKMEEYTEYIGVCRDCFDPRSSAMDAPRKHHYHSHGRRSNEPRRGRIDKDSRYYSSDNDRRKSNKGSWIATGLAGYGLAKVGKQRFNSNRDDFDDTYSVKSGRYQSKASVRRHSRSRSRDRKSRASYSVAGGLGSSHRGQVESSLTGDGKSYKIVRRHSRSRSRSRDRKEDPQYKITRRRSRSRSSSRSRGYKNGLIGAALGAAVGASAAGKSSKHRSRSNSPSGSFVRRRPSGGRDKRRSQEGLGSVLGLGRTDNRRSSRRSDASSSYIDISRTSTTPANTGFIAGFFSTPEKTERRRKVHSKKRKGFFNFSNASSSSSDNGLAYGVGFAKARKPKRKSSDDKLNATLTGLGATAAALAVAQHGRGKSSSNRRRPEVVAVKESKGRRSKHGRRGSSSSDEDGWESASDAGDDSSSVNSGLAFGDYDFKGKGKSTESLVSNDSGTSKWLWRWGSKKKKTKPSPSLTHQNSSTYFGPAAVGVAGAAVGAALGRNESAMSSHSSVPTMQTVYPVSTNDRYNFDAQPIVTSRPDIIPLQQPQPVVPVTSAVYSTSPAYSRQTDYTSSYVKPTGPPVFSTIPTPSQKFDSISNASRPSQDSDDHGRPKLPKRGHSSPTQSSFKRDAAIAGVAAAAGIAVASHKRKQTAQSPGAVRFDLTEEESERDHKKRKDQERKHEEREKKRQDLKRKEDEEREREREREQVREFELQRAKEQREEDARREYERERTRKRLEGEEIRRREDERREAIRQEEERRRADETRKEAERRQSLIEAERHQRELTEREQRRQSMIEAERLQCEQNERDERDRRSREAIEAERRAELDRESQRQAAQADTNKREELEREVEALRLEQERLERKYSGSSVKPQTTGDSQRSWNLENRQRELENREKDIINPDDWKKSAAAAVGGAAVASVVASAIGSSREKEDDSKRRGKKDKKKRASREGSPKVTEDELPQKPVSSTPRAKDAGQERTRPEKSKTSVTDDADQLVKEMSRRYSEDAPSQAEFFAPPELTSPSAPASPRISPDADAEVYAYPAHGVNIMIVEPPRQPPYETPYSFTTDSSGYDPSRYNLPWPVPSLKLIMPTPPGSIAGSVTGGRSPGVSPGVSPVIQPQDAPKDSSKDVPKDVPKDLPTVSTETPEPAKSSSSKVRWGEPETFHYQPATPESFREQYISRDDLNNSNDRPYSREETADQQPYYRYEKSSKDDSREQRVEERYANRNDSRDKDRRFEEAGTPDTEDEIVSSRPYDPTQKVDESQSPETQPVVVEPSKSVLNDARFYQQPFYESASDIGLDTAQVKSDAPSTAPGYVEGEITEEPEEFFEATSTMPGGFIDDEEPETKPEKPLTKKEKRKLEKSKRKESLDEPKLESANGVSSQNGDNATRETETTPAVPIEWETNTTKKDKKKKKRGSTDRDIRDIEPETPDSSHEGGVGLGETIATAGAASVLAGVVAQAISKKQENGSQVQPETRSARTDAQDEPSAKENGRQSSIDEEKYRTIPSNAFDDVEELADVKTPSKKGKRRSKNWSPVASPLRSQVGWEDYVGDRVTPEAAATVTEPTQTKYEPKLETTAFPDFDTKADTTRPDDYVERKRSKSLEKVPELQGEWKTSKPTEREPIVYDERGSSKSTERESSVYDERRSSKSTGREPSVYDERQSSKSTEKEPSVYDDARSVKSDSRYDEDRERRHSKHRESRGDDSRSTIDDRYEEDHERRRSKHRDSSYDAACKREDDRDDGEHKRRHRRRESEREKSPSPSDKYKRSSIVPEPSYRYDDDGEEKKRSKHRKHRDGDKERSTSPSDKYKRSSAASEPGDLYESSHKSRRRSKRDSVDFDDTASVASSPAKYNEEKKEKKGGIFGLLSGLKSTDSLASTSKSRSKDSRNEDDDPERKRKKKHRSSTAGSTYGSDNDDRSRSERKERRHRSSVAGSTYGSDDDDRKSERREKRRSRDAHREGDQSFLGERAVETTKLPVNLSTTPATKPVLEFHSYEELFQDSLIPEGILLPISRPSSPSGIDPRSRDALTSPSGVTEPAPLTTPPSLSLMRASSTTAVPFRLRRPPPSPSTPRSESWTAAASSPVVPSPGPVPEIRRHSRGDSAEIKRKSGEIKQTELRPFYLLESTRKVHDVEESLPSLPPSIPSSRSPSIQGSEGFETESADNWESAVENPDESASEMFHSPAGSRVGLADTSDDEKDYLDSQQATPKASEFPSDVKAMMQDDSSAKHLPEQPDSPRSLAHEMLQKALAAEAYESAKSTGIDSPESDAAVKTSTFSREALEDAATAVLVGGSVAAIVHELLNKRGDSNDSNESISKDLSQIPKDLPPQETKVDEPLEAIAAQVETRQPPDEDYFDDFMSGAPNEEDLHLAPVKETEEAEPAPIPPSPSGKSSKKGKKAKRGSSISSVGESAKGMTADELQTIREQDAEFGVGSWFEEPKTPKTEPPSVPEKTTPTTTTTIPEALMRRDSLKGKKKKAAKKGKRGLSISEEPELSLGAASGPSTDSEQPGDTARDAATDETSDSKDDTPKDETKDIIRASSVEFGPPLVLEPTASSKDIPESTPLKLQPAEDLDPGAETLPSEDVLSPADEAPGGVQLGDSIIPEAPATFGPERDIRMEELSPEQSGNVTPVISSEAEKPVPRNKKSKKRNGKKVNELAQLYEPEAPSSSLSSELQEKDNDQARSLDQLREVEAVSETEPKPTQDKSVESAESQPVEQPVSNLPSGAEADLESSWTDTSKKQKKKSKKVKKRQSLGLDNSEAKQSPRESSELPADISSTQETAKDLPEPGQITTVEVDDTIPPSGDKGIDTTQDRAVLETPAVLDDKNLPNLEDSKALPTGDLPTEGLPTQELLQEPLHAEALPTDGALKANAPGDTAVEAKSPEKAPGLEDVTPSAPPTTEAPTVKPVEEKAPAQQSSLFGRISGWFGKKETPEAPIVDIAESPAEQSSPIVHAVTETAESVLDKEVIPSTENIGKDTALDLTSKEAAALEPNTKPCELVNESAPESLGFEQDFEKALKEHEETLPPLESRMIPDQTTTAKPVEAEVTTPAQTDSADQISTPAADVSNVLSTDAAPVAVEEPADDEQWGFTPKKKGKKSKGKKSINEPQPAPAATPSQTKQEPTSDVTKVDIDTAPTANKLRLEGEQRDLDSTEAVPVSTEDPADSTEPISAENSEWAPLPKKSKKKKGKDKRVSLIEEPQIAEATESSTAVAGLVAHSQAKPTLEAQPESTVNEIAETIPRPVDASLTSTERPLPPSDLPKEEIIPEESTSFDNADSKSESKKKAKKGKGKGKRGSVTEEPKDLSTETVPSAEDVDEATAVSKELELSGPERLGPVTETGATIDETGTVEPITSENQIEVPSIEGNRELADTTEAANLEEVIPTQVTDATVSDDLDEPTVSGKKKNKKGKGKRNSTVSESIAETTVPEPAPKTVSEHIPDEIAESIREPESISEPIIESPIESIPGPEVRLESSIDQNESAEDAMALQRTESNEFAVDFPETIQEIAHQAEGEPPLGPVEATLDEAPLSSDPPRGFSWEESQTRGQEPPEEEWPVSTKKIKKGKKGKKGKASGTVTPKEMVNLDADRSLVDETPDSKNEDTTAITSSDISAAAAISEEAAQEPQPGLEAGEDEWAAPGKRGKKDKKGKKKEIVQITPETTTTVDAKATPDSIEALIDATTPAPVLPEQAVDPTDLAVKAVPSPDDRTITTADDSVLERPIAAQAPEPAVEDEIASSSKKSKKAKKAKKNKRASGTVTPIAPTEPIFEPSEEPAKDSSFTERSEEPHMQPVQPRELDDVAAAEDDSMAKDEKDSLAHSAEVDLTSEAQPTQPVHETVATPDQGSADEFFETSTLPTTQETTAVDPETTLEPQEIPLSKENSREAEGESVDAQPSGKKSKKGKKSKRGSLADVTPLQDPAITSSEQISTEPGFSVAQTQETPAIERSFQDVAPQIEEPLPSEQTGVAPEVLESSWGETVGKKGKKGKKSKRGSIPSTPIAEEPIVEAAEAVTQELPASDVSEEKSKDPQESAKEQQIDNGEAEENLWGESSGKKKKKKGKKSKRDSEISIPTNEAADLEQLDPEKQDDIIVASEAPPIVDEPLSEQTQNNTLPTTKDLEIEPAKEVKQTVSSASVVNDESSSALPVDPLPLHQPLEETQFTNLPEDANTEMITPVETTAASSGHPSTTTVKTITEGFQEPTGKKSKKGKKSRKNSVITTPVETLPEIAPVESSSTQTPNVDDTATSLPREIAPVDEAETPATPVTELPVETHQSDALENDWAPPKKGKKAKRASGAATPISTEPEIALQDTSTELPVDQAPRETTTPVEPTDTITDQPQASLDNPQVDDTEEVSLPSKKSQKGKAAKRALVPNTTVESSPQPDNLFVAPSDEQVAVSEDVIKTLPDSRPEPSNTEAQTLQESPETAAPVPTDESRDLALETPGTEATPEDSVPIPTKKGKKGKHLSIPSTPPAVTEPEPEPITVDEALSTAILETPVESTSQPDDISREVEPQTNQEPTEEWGFTSKKAKKAKKGKRASGQATPASALDDQILSQKAIPTGFDVAAKDDDSSAVLRAEESSRDILEGKAEVLGVEPAIEEPKIEESKSQEENIGQAVVEEPKIELSSTEKSSVEEQRTEELQKEEPKLEDITFKEPMTLDEDRQVKQALPAEEEDLWTPSSKKKGKKNKATSFDEPKAILETPVEDEPLKDPAVPLAEGLVESKAVEEARNILAEGPSAIYATEPPVLEDQSQPLSKSIDTDLPLTEEPASIPIDTLEQSKDGDAESTDFAIKKTKKEKRKSKKGKNASWSEPETPAEPADISEPLVEISLAPTELPTIASVPELPQPDLSLPDSSSHLEASLGASGYQDSGYQSRVLPEQPAESSKEPEPSTIPETAPIGSERRSPSPKAADFAATLMAGLEDSGFPLSLVTKNPEYFQESSPPQSAAEPEPEEVFTTTSRKKKGKKGKQSRAASIGESKDTEIPAEISEDVESKPVQTREEVEPTTTTTKTETSSKDSAFDAAIAAGIALAGLSTSHSGRTSPTEALPIEPESEITWQKRPKKGKKGRASQSETPTESQEPIAVEIPVLDAATSEGLPRANPSDNVSESTPAIFEDEPFLDATETFQDIPEQSEQPAEQGTTSEPSAPANLTASRDFDAEPEDQPFSLSKKKTKKAKQEKKRSLALNDPLPLTTETQQPDTGFKPPTSTPIEAAEASESIPQSQHVEAPIDEDSHGERTILDDTQAQSAPLPLEEVPISDAQRDLSTDVPPTKIADSAQLDNDFGFQPKKTKKDKKGRKDTAASEPSAASDDIFVQESLQEEPGTLKELEDQPSTSQEAAWEPLTRKKSKKGKKAQKDTPVVVDTPTEASATENDDASTSREVPVTEDPLNTQDSNIEDASRGVDDPPAPIPVLPSETALPIDSGIDPKEFSSKPVQPVNPTADQQPPVDVGLESLGRKKSKKGKKGRKSTLDWADEEATSEVPPATREQEPAAFTQPEVAPFITQPEPAVVDEPAPTVEHPPTTAPTLPAVRQLSAEAEEQFPFPVQEKSIVEPEIRDETVDASREVEATPDVEKEEKKDDEWAFTTSKGKGKKAKKGKKTQADVVPAEEDSKEASRLVDSEDIKEGEFGMVKKNVEPEERGSQANEEDWGGISVGKKNKKNKKGKKSSGAATPITETADLAKDIALGAIAGGLLSKAFDDDKPSTDEKPKSGPEVTSRKIEQHDMPTQEDSQAMPLSIDTTGPSITKADNKLADRFPGLERVKRRAPQSSPALEPREKRIHLPDVTVEKPTPEPDIIAIPKDIPRSSTEDALPLPQDPASLSAESAAELLNKELHKARSDRSLKEVLEPTWSFPDNRDSGLHVVDSPPLTQPQTGGEWVRDSGFHDAPLTPVSRQSDRFEQESDDAATREKSIHPTVNFSMGDAEHVDISERQSVPPEPTTSNVESEWALPVKKQRRSQDYSERDSTQSIPEKQSVTPQREISPTEEASPEFPSASAGMTTPSAVDSTTKQRASYLFKSSPSVQFGSPAESPATERRETPRGLFASAASTPAGQKQPLPSVEHTETSTESHVDEPSTSIFGDGPLSDTERSAYVSSPFRHMRSPSVPLDTIREYSPEDSPLSKKSREVGDVGAPERGVKSRRKLRGSIQEEPISDQLKSPPRTPIGKTIGSEQPRETSKPPISTDQLIEQLSWPEVDEDKETVGLNRNLTLTPSAPQNQRRSGSGGVDPVKQSPRIASPTSASDRSGGSINRFRTPDHLRPLSASSNRSSTPPLRRVNRSQSSDLRAAAKLSEPKAAKSGRKAAQQSTRAPAIEPAIPGPSTYDPAKDKGKGRAVDMADVYEGWGDSQASPMSPTRPPSVRKRQSMQIIDLEAQLRMMEAENRKLVEQSARAEESVNFATQQQSRDVSEQVEARDRDMRAKDVEIAQLIETLRALQEEVNRLTEINEGLTEANRNLSADTNARYATLQEESSHANSQWQASLLALEALRVTHSQLKSNMEKVVGDEINSALAEKNAEIERLNRELQAALVTIEQTKQQILSSKEGDSFLTIRDEDYFDSACQQLCQHVQSWVLRFSKYSDKRACRLSSDIRDDKIEARLDNAILDGSDVDDLLRDRQKRRDVFMSVVMTMVWEFVFTRYLFGMDRDQRQKLKALEKQLSDIGPQRAVAHWRAITLTLLSKRDAFKKQRSDDTEAVVLEIYATLAKLLPPPSQYVSQIKDSLHNILKLAVTLSIEMRSQRAEYIMLPPLQPDYDTNGDLVRKVHFNASLMNERSGDTSSNEELEQRDAVVRLVLFPLVVKKGNDVGEGDDEIVVCPAQVLVAKPKSDRKVVRVLSGAMQMGAGSQAGRSVISVDMRDADDI